MCTLRVRFVLRAHCSRGQTRPKKFFWHFPNRKQWHEFLWFGAHENIWHSGCMTHTTWRDVCCTANVLRIFPRWADANTPQPSHSYLSPGSLGKWMSKSAESSARMLSPVSSSKKIWIQCSVDPPSTHDPPQRTIFQKFYYHFKHQQLH